MKNIFPVNTNTFEKGLNRDSNKLSQPKGTYWFLLNGLLESTEGDIMMPSNEKGNEVCVDLPKGYNLLGSVLLDNDDRVLFFSTNDGFSVIGLQKVGCKYEELIKSSCLGFNHCFPIDSIFRLKNGCDRSIYFTDCINSPYNIDIDSLEKYVCQSIKDECLSKEDAIAKANEEDCWDCNEFKIFRDVKIPNINLQSVSDTGGNLKVGTYQFSIRYLDNDLNPTNWFYVTPTVPIWNESRSLAYRLIDGGVSSNNESAAGEEGLAFTSKSINLEITNLDTSYSFYQIAILETTDNIARVSDVYIQPERPINEETEIYTFTEVNPESDVSSTIDEVTIPRLVIDKAKHIAQKDNRLLLSNIRNGVLDYAKFQRKASQIGTKYKTKAGSKENIRNNSPKSPETYFNCLSYMRNEVYAFGIVWVLNNGTNTPAFHIPGRPINTNPIDCSNISPEGIDFSQSTQQCICIDYTVDEGQLNRYNNGNPIFDPGGTQGGGVIGTVPSSVSVRFNLNGVSQVLSALLRPTSIGTGVLVLGCYSEEDVISSVEASSLINNNTGTFLLDTARLHTLTDSDINMLGGDPSIPDARFSWDYDLISDFANPDNIVFRSEEIGELPRRHNIYNTAIRTARDCGIMGYHDNGENNLYPDIKDCSNESIWGTDICGNELEGTPIRHHKFPAASLECVQDDENIYHMGVEFFNIEPPEEYADMIQGYYIVRGDRTNINKTVMAKGYLDRMVYMSNDRTDRATVELENPRDGNAAITYFGLYPEWEDDNRDSFIDDRLADNENFRGHDEAVILDNMFNFHSAEGYFNRDFLGGNYVKVERIYERNNPLYHTWIDKSDIQERLGESNWTLQSWCFDDCGQPPESGSLNRGILDSAYIDPRLGPTSFDGYSVFHTMNVSHPDGLQGVQQGTVINHLVSNQINPYSFNFRLDPANWYYVAIMRYRNVYTNLNSIRYLRTHTGILTESTATVFGGDIHISRMGFSMQTFDNDRSYAHGYIESEINSELRHTAELPRDSYYQGPNPTIANHFNLLQWMTRYERDEDFIEFTDQDNEAAREFVWQDYWAYNRDFSKQQIENFYFSLPTSFDYCAKCRDYHPHRIAYSEQSFQEERTDNYRAFLTNNYSDILGDQGEISNMFVDKDRLFVHTCRALWEIQTRPNQIVTSEETLFIGTGDLLSVPPRRLVTTDYGYGGSCDKFGTVTTEFGTVFVDTRMGKVFLLSQGLQEISLLGMRNWFEENLPLNLPEQFMCELGKEYPCINSTSSVGVGVRTYYDPRFRRVIISKRDFIMTDKLISSIKNGMIKCTENGFEHKTGVMISFQDTRYFCNNSWTISYNLAEKKWVGWHSYLPINGYNDHDTFYTVTDGNSSIWKHNYGPYQTYYGTKYDFIIDFISNAEIVAHKNYYTIEYSADSTIFSEDTSKEIATRPITFDRFYMYSEQSITSTNNLIFRDKPYLEITHDSEISYIKLVEDRYRISRNIRDICINPEESRFTCNWQDLESYFNVDGLGNGYIDEIPNEDYRDVNKSVYLRARVQGKWAGLRLFFKPDENVKLVLHYVNTSYSKRNR